MTYRELINKLHEQGKNVKLVAGNNILFEGSKSNKRRNGFLKVACNDDMIDDVLTGKGMVVLMVLPIDEVKVLLAEVSP